MSLDVGAAGGKPVIAVLCKRQQLPGKEDYDDIQDYCDAVSAAGGSVRCIAPSTDAPESYLSGVAGMLIPGGADIDPSFYQQAVNGSRPGDKNFDAFEFQAVQHGFQTGMPMFGICRGQQMMNVAAGGTLIQDINSQTRRAPDLQIEHAYTQIPSFRNNNTFPIHNILVNDAELGRVSNLTKDFGFKFMAVNSSHHQALALVSPMFAVTARCLDGIVEAIERKDLPTQWGVQWHPERQRKDDPIWSRLFDRLVADSSAWQRGTTVTQASAPAEPAPITTKPTESVAAKKPRRVRVPKLTGLEGIQDQLFSLRP